MDKPTIATYNQLAKEYDEETRDFWTRFPVELLDRFAELVKGKVLDVGSGPGRDGLLLKAKGLDVICLDASRAMVTITRAKGLESVEADFNHMPFPECAFDGVWCYTALLHIPKSQAGGAMSEITRVLAPGGIFALGLIEGGEEGYRESAGMNMPRYFAYYTREEVEALAHGHGFSGLFFEAFQPRTRRYLHFIFKKK